jgi:CGNR zinc finger/Putative stress-induced transcription regulator
MVHTVFEPEDHCLDPHATPPEALLVGRFVNTVDYRTFGQHEGDRDRERFSSPEAMADWLVTNGLLSAGTPVTDDDLRLALAVRTRLRQSLGDPGFLATPQGELGPVEQALGVIVQLERDTGPTLVAQRAGVAGALTGVLIQAVNARAAGQLARLKVCQAQDCRWVFYDLGRSRTGRWCAMETCGNRMKTRRYRERRRAATSAG